MTSALWAAAMGALALLLQAVLGWLKQGRDQSTGAALEAGKVSAQTAVTQAAVAQAAVQAPSTTAGVVDELNKGEF